MPVPGNQRADGTESQLRSFVYPAVPPSPETGIPPTVHGREEEKEEGPRHYPPEGTPPTAVRVGVWDTATVTSSNYLPVSSSQSNHFNMGHVSGYYGANTVNPTAAQKQWQPQTQRESGSHDGHGDGDGEFSSGVVPVKLSKYDILLEKSEKPAFPPGVAAAGVAAQAIGGGSASDGSFYPKLVDRNGASGGGYPDVGGGGNGLQEDGAWGDTGKTSAPRNGTPRADALDGSLARAAERSLSVEDDGLQRMGSGGGSRG